MNVEKPLTPGQKSQYMRDLANKRWEKHKRITPEEKKQRGRENALAYYYRKKEGESEEALMTNKLNEVIDVLNELKNRIDILEEKIHET